MNGKGDPGEMTEAGGPRGQATVALTEPLLPFWDDIPMSSKTLQTPENRPAKVETAIVLELTVALLADPPTQLTIIGVDNDEGIVTLTGEVGNAEVRRMAGEIASSHPGVASAINDLRLSPSDVPHAKHVSGEIDQEEERNGDRTQLP
jgi:hypothetical protein